MKLVSSFYSLNARGFRHFVLERVDLTFWNLIQVFSYEVTASDSDFIINNNNSTDIRILGGTVILSANVKYIRYPTLPAVLWTQGFIQ